MSFKNFNTGEIKTNGGNVHIGDVIDGLAHLLNEYREQIQSIKSLLNSFKPRTALNLLDDLEKRVKKSNLTSDDISSRIFFLKALCMAELVEFNTKDTAKCFIRAYNLNNSDKEIRNRACVEYLNIDEKGKAESLAEEIIKDDEFSHIGWFVLAVVSSDFNNFLSKIPRVLLEDYFFQHSLIFHIIRTSKLNYIEDLLRFGLTLNVDVNKYKELTFGNKNTWLAGIDLLINKIFNEYPVRYISGKKFGLKDNPLIDDCLSLLEAFINKLSNTEIQNSIYHQQFFYNYFKYFKTNENKYYEAINIDYKNLDSNWFYTFAYCQVINHQEDFKKSLKILNEFENENSELSSEFFLFKATILHLSKKEQLILPVLDDYLSSLDLIDEKNGFNIINVFLNLLYKKVDEKKFNEQIDKILSKEFISNDLRSIIEITCQIRFTKEFDSELIYSKLKALSQNNTFDENYKNLLCENLDKIGKTSDAIDYLNSYLDKNIISESLRIYILLLEKHLYNNTQSGQGIYKELMDLLKFWRLNSPEADEGFLGIEHNLNLEKNDWNELKEIDYVLYTNFPDKEIYKLFYLVCLNKLKLTKEFNKFSEEIPENYISEKYGLQIARLLLGKDKTKTKGAKILYNLAISTNNTKSRATYFGLSHLFGENIFKRYDTITENVWVRYKVNNIEEEFVKVNNNKGFKKEFIGKKVGDKFSMQNEITKEFNVIEIIDAFNDELKLNFDIQNEAKNPINDLGFTSFEVPEKIEDFEKVLMDKFGIQQEQEQKQIQKLLKDYYNYRIGFSEISRSVFRDDYIESYLSLTGDSTHLFTTLPNLATQNINLAHDKEVKYILDFSSLMLFFNLSRVLEINFIHTFSISFLIKEFIEEKVLIEKNSPSSPLSIQISPKGITRYVKPDNFKEKRVDYFQSLLNWVNSNCEVDYVEEKLDLSLRLNKQHTSPDRMLKILFDYMHLSSREDSRLITSDSTLYLVHSKNRVKHNLLNPEKYLVAYYPDNNNTELFRFLLKSNYLGISINTDTLRNEFYAFLTGQENYYHRCLQNIQYSIHNDLSMIDVICKFLKEVFCMPSITREHKNRYSLEILKSAFSGMPKKVVDKFEKKMKEEFLLLGESYDDILESFIIVRKLYNIN